MVSRTKLDLKETWTLLCTSEEVRWLLVVVERTSYRCLEVQCWTFPVVTSKK